MEELVFIKQEPEVTEAEEHSFELLQFAGVSDIPVWDSISLEDLVPATATDEAGDILKSGDPKRPFQCCYCEKTYTKKSHVRRHMFVHTGAKPFHCSFCNMRFTRIEYKNQHELSHFGNSASSPNSNESEYDSLLVPTGVVQVKEERDTFDEFTDLLQTASTPSNINHEKTYKASSTSSTSVTRTPGLPKTYPCGICPKTFARKDHKIRHERIHTGEKPYECSICETRFSRLDNKTQHMLKHFTENNPSSKSVKDSEHSGELTPSEIAFNEALKITIREMNKKKMKRRASEHASVQPAPKAQQSSKSLLKCNYPEYDRSQPPFECSVCRKLFHRKDNLNRHEKIHSGDRPYSCEICEKSFVRKDHRDTHFATHSAKPGKRRKSVSVNSLNYNNSSNHNMANVLHSVKNEPSAFDQLMDDPQSSNTFNNPLKPVQFKSSKEAEYKCEFCGKTFTRKGHLGRHNFIHTGIRPYKCSQCSMTFARADYLKNHMRRHSENIIYSCKICKLSFDNNAECVNHVETHNQQTYEPPVETNASKSLLRPKSRPFECDRCEKSYTKKSHLNRHYLSHMGPVETVNVLPKCQYCNREFSRTDNKNAHERNNCALRNGIPGNVVSNVKINNEFNSELRPMTRSRRLIAS